MTGAHIKITWQSAGVTVAKEFTQSFTVGRDAGADVRIDDPSVSKRHSEVTRSGKSWFVHDLSSANGTYLNGKQIKFAPIDAHATLNLGHDGPSLSLTPSVASNVMHASPPSLSPTQEHAAPKSNSDPASVTQFIESYLQNPADGNTGVQAEVVRKAFDRVQSQRTNRYRGLLIAALIAVIAALGFAAFQYQQTNNLRTLAIDIFYNMKSIEAQMHRLDNTLGSTASAEQRAELGKSVSQVQEMSNRYDNFVEKAGGLKKGLSESDKLIMRVARMFGECELNAPDGFLQKVHEYIARWQQTKRLPNAIARAEQEGYTPLIHAALVSRKLPPHFFYLALQESNFHARAVGPETRFGIAKGMWQFLPTTGSEYGLNVGDMTDVREFDLNDQRFDVEKASEAAARYLSDIYGGEAQASGLLVMASYNWGHNRVRRLIRTMPDDPAQRNFWQLITNHKVPEETYDYVFQIFSAAVIGEDPAMFGFDFAPPLTELTYQWEGQ